MIDIAMLHARSFDNREGITDMLSTGEAPKDNCLFLLSFELSKFPLADVICGIHFGMRQEIQMCILIYAHSFLKIKPIHEVFFGRMFLIFFRRSRKDLLIFFSKQPDFFFGKDASAVLKYMDHLPEKGMHPAVPGQPGFIFHGTDQVPQDMRQTFLMPGTIRVV